MLDEPRPSTWFRSSALLDVRGLRVSPSAGALEVVRGVTLTITQGEIVGLLGDSDSGAREIALALSGLLTSTDRLTGGSILFTGIELVGLPERRLARVRGTDISFVPRDPARSLDATLTIAHHLQTPLRRTMGFSRRASSSLSLELLARVGFTDPRALLDLYPADLTPFMAQRVLIAGAISCDPLLVVADNPTSSLRPNDAHAVVDLLHDLHQELALTLVIVTDSLSMVAQSCRQVAVVERGMIVEHASVAELLHSPQHEHSQRLVAARNADLAAE